MSHRDVVLVVSNKVDPHSDHVISALYDLGVRPVRLNTEDALANNVLTLHHSQSLPFGGTIRIKDSNRECALDEIRSVYYRRPKNVKTPETLEEDMSARHAAAEMEESLQGLYESIQAFWLNDLRSMERGQHKLLQLRIAAEIGLDTPATVVSNDPEQLLQFAASRQKVAVKTLSVANGLSVGDQAAMVYTWPTTYDELLKERASLSYCPLMLQEWVEKSSELRVTVVGRKVFACEMLTQEHPMAREDYRVALPREVKHKVFCLPQEVADKLVALHVKMGLAFGAVDLVLTPDSRFVFLETNVNGQWLWIENLTGMPICESIAQVLAAGQADPLGPAEVYHIDNP